METDSEIVTDDTTIDPPPAEKKKSARKRPAKGAPPRTTVTKPASTPKKRGKAVRTELKVGDMTPDELKLVRALYSEKGPREAKTLHELQKEIWPKLKGTSKARNTLRRPVKFGWVELREPTKVELAAHEKAKAGRLYSKYQLTEKGRKRGLKG